MRNEFSYILDGLPKSGIREFFDLVMDADDIISLGVGEPDFPTPWTVREEAIYALEKGITSYTSNKGMEKLRSAIANYYDKRFKVRYNHDTEILITNGASEGADLALRSLLNPGDEVLIPQPMYVCYDPLTRLTGATVVPIDTSKTEFIPDPKAIEAAITPQTKLLILCSPSNPTGRIIPKPVLEEIAKIAQKHDIWVLSDEIYAEIDYKNAFCAFASLPNMKQRTITLNGFSKAYAMTGWRIGYIAAPESLITRATKIHAYSALCCSVFGQLAAIDALKNAGKEVEKMKKSYEQRRSLIVDGLNEIGLETIMPEGAFYCFPSIKSTGLSSHEFAIKLLKEKKIAVIPGTAFGAEGENHIRCCFATQKEDLISALNAIKAMLKSP